MMSVKRVCDGIIRGYSNCVALKQMQCRLFISIEKSKIQSNKVINYQNKTYLCTSNEKPCFISFIFKRRKVQQGISCEI